MSDYRGHEVEIKTEQYGIISGIVTNYDDERIELSDVTIDGQKISEPIFSVKSEQIGRLKVLSTADDRQTQKTHSSRELRRERLRKIPGAITAYVCDKSPPRILKTPQPNKINHQMEMSGGGSFKQLKMDRGDSFSFDRRNKAQSNHNLSSDSASGFESGSATFRGPKLNGRCYKTRGRYSSSTNNDCFSLRVEDFINTDFDFEANLAKFDKEAFYEKTDAKNRAFAKNELQNLTTECNQVLVEGPDGIGYEPVPISKIIRPSSPLNRLTPDPPANFQSGWYSPTGKKVPFVAASVHDRILQFLATGLDPTGVANPLPLGLSWTRIIELAGTAIVNSALSTIKQTTQLTPQTNNLSCSNQPIHDQQHPLRVLVLPGRENLSGALALNMARQLANRDSACVLLCAHPHDHQSTNIASSSSSSSSFPAYVEELTLAQTVAPQSSNFSHPRLDHFSVDSSDDEDSVEENSLISGTGDCDLKYSTRRLWAGRIPGLILVTKSCIGVTRQPMGVKIDLLILGQLLEEYPTGIHQWLAEIKSIGLAIQLAAVRPPFRADSLAPSQALRTWVVQLGLPVASPMQVPESVDIRLVDVGMTKWVLSRLATDQRSFPPPGLFETTSCIRLTGRSA
ncbi:hypothetical protein Aperf_G00000059889 [Anoplocephala perfoliata]